MYEPGGLVGARQRWEAELAATGAGSAIERHGAQFETVVARAEAYAAAGRFDAAAVYAQIAAKYAASRHTGLYASARLEHVLSAIGRSSGTGEHARPRYSGDPARVLHVLTQVAGIGGHSRLVWRLIGQDRRRAHSVAITRQGAVRIPPALQAAVHASGGELHVLDAGRGGLIDWAAALRATARSADLVMLHSNPDDVVPLVAFADPTDRPPVALVDHSDQLFWLGVAIADVLVSLRRSGMQLAISRRGVAPERCVLLPIALSPIERTLARPEAKRKLGLPDDSVLLLSIARGHKYLPLDGMTLYDAVRPLLERYRHTYLLVVGPDDSGDWAAARERAAGRVRALGVREDTALFYQAADIYLDSFPICSITSLLEAGCYELPLAALCATANEHSVICADTPALDTCLLKTGDLQHFRATVSRLIEDPDYRRMAGQRSKRDITAVHSGERWQRALQRVYRRAAEVQPAAAYSAPKLQVGADEVDALLPRVFANEPDLDTITQFNIRLLPLDLRLRSLAGMLRRRGRLYPGLCLPEWLAVRFEQRRYPQGSDRDVYQDARRPA